MYQVRILDRNRTIQAVLPGVAWNYSRRINEATELSVSIPREVIDTQVTAPHPLAGFFADAAGYADLASFIQVYKGSALKVSGRIAGRTLGDTVTIKAYTEEILLEGTVTPAQYGKVWDGWDLADVARDVLDGWESIRIKDSAQWTSHITSSSQVDLTTEPGAVMLAKQATGRYYSSGYVVLRFQSSEVTDFVKWDRIRWSADSADPVRTTIQYGIDGSTWSEEFDGGLPEEIGLVPNWGTAATVYVRINLYTTDTKSEDPDGNPVGVTPMVFALEAIARTAGQLTAGTIPATAGVTVKGISADHETALGVLLSACEQVGWEFTVENGELTIAEQLGSDRTAEFVLRAGTNMTITSLGDDDQELVNILTAYGPGQGINRMELVVRDTASIAEYGEYPRAVQFDAATLAGLQQQAADYLAVHAAPVTAFQVQAAFDCEHEPDYGVGDTVRVVDPERSILVTTRIMSESRDYSEGGLSVRLDLGKPALSLQGVLEGGRPPKPADPAKPTGVWAEGIIAGIAAGCAPSKSHSWAWTECHVSTTPGFTPSPATMKARGPQTRFEVSGLQIGVRHYVRLVHVDTAGRSSAASDEVSAVPQPTEQPDSEPPATPTVTARAIAGGVAVTTSTPTESDWAYDEVYVESDYETGDGWSFAFSLGPAQPTPGIIYAYASVDTAVKRSGAASQRMDSTGAYALNTFIYLRSPRYSCVPGSSWAYKGYARKATFGDCLVGISWSNDAGAVLGYTEAVILPGTSSWALFEQTSVSPPAGAEAATYVQLVVRGLGSPSTPGTVWLDDLEFRPVGGANVLTNGGFETAGGHSVGPRFVAAGKTTYFEITEGVDLARPVTVWVRRVDTSGNASGYSDPVTVTTGTVTTRGITPGAVTRINRYIATGSERWSNRATLVDIADMVLSFEVTEPTESTIQATLAAVVGITASSDRPRGTWHLLLDGTVVNTQTLRGTPGQSDGYTPASLNAVEGTVVLTWAGILEAGWHEVKVQWKVIKISGGVGTAWVGARDRTIIVQQFKR